jgi:uncharacterized protein YciI
MRYFLFRLNPPRPTFSQDMSADERSVMQAHVAYWMDLTQKGTAIVFGPVADPAGAWGVGIVQVDDAAAAQAISDNDPAITSGIGLTFDILAMPQALVRPVARREGAS